MTSSMKQLAMIILAALLIAAGAPTQAASDQDWTVKDATEVLHDFVDIPESSIPPALLANAYGIAVIPQVIKAGLILGGRYGKGVLAIRHDDGSWSNPVFVKLMGGSLGWQIGVSSTDVILVFKSRESIEKIVDGQVTLGADASVAAGPVGRTAGAVTNLHLNAEIYSYSRARGLFAGVAINGGSISIDRDADFAYYGDNADAQTILGRSDARDLPDSGQLFISTLDHYMSADAYDDLPADDDNESSGDAETQSNIGQPQAYGGQPAPDYGAATNGSDEPLRQQPTGAAGSDNFGPVYDDDSDAGSDRSDTVN